MISLLCNISAFTLFAVILLLTVYVLVQESKRKQHHKQLKELPIVKIPAPERIFYVNLEIITKFPQPKNQFPKGDLSQQTKIPKGKFSR